MRKQRHFLVVVMVLVGFFVVSVPAPTAASPDGQGPAGCDGYPRCVGGSWCTCSLDGGTIGLSCGGECESSGGEDGDSGQTCTPGDTMTFKECDESGDGSWFTTYACNADGQWELQYGPTLEYVACSEEFDRICWANEDGSDWECWEWDHSNGTPCEDMDWGASGIQCLSEFGLSVSVSVPCQQAVYRFPYPRGMVLVPNRVWLGDEAPAWNEAWSNALDYQACLDYGLGEGDRAIRNYRIGLAWERLDMEPYWSIEGAGEFRGWSVGGLVWEQASWGKPECGPPLEPGDDLLPAYRGQVYTYWRANWRVQYEIQKSGYECIWRSSAAENGECGCVPDEYDGQCSDDTNGDGISDWAGWVPTNALCDDDENDDDIPDDHCWETSSTSWTPMDLRIFGYPTSYFISNAAGPVPTAQEPNPSCNGFCIPVIEVQGVISNPRR